MMNRARCALTAHFVASVLLSVSSLTNATTAEAATYYVSASGDDGRTGTAIASAWRSLDRVNRQQLAPGDSVLFEGGRTFSGQLYLDRADAGRSDLPVSIGSYGPNGRATISNAQGTAIVVYNTAGVRIANLVVTGAGRDVNTGSGILFYNLACYWSLAGGKEHTLEYLQQAFAMNPDYRDMVGKESDFDPLRNDADFQALTSIIV